MIIEELLKDRYKVIADYPGSHLKIGVTIDEDYGRMPTDAPNEFEKYPAIFRKLKWYEERAIEDMPMFLKVQESCIEAFGKYIKVEEWDMKSNVPCPIWEDHRTGAWYFTPATEQEYLTYQTQSKPPIV